MKVVSALSILVSAVNANVVLYHRIFHPSLQNLEFLERGTISGDPPTFKASESFAHDIQMFSKVLGSAPDALYQISMTSEGSGFLWNPNYSSVKVCHLQPTSMETLIIHTTDENVPVSLDYFVSPIPGDGTCPKGRIGSSWDALADMNITILFKQPIIPQQPELRAPPPLTAEGEVVKPPQKSFIQKYWMYIVGFLFVMMIASPEEPEQPRNNDQASS